MNGNEKDGNEMPILPMGKLILKSIFKKPVTVLYPLKPKLPAEGNRGMIQNQIESCVFCGICQKKCPTGAIEVARTDKTWSIERFCCVQCGCCVEVCPKKCLSLIQELPKPARSMGKDVLELARVSGDTADHTNSAGVCTKE